MVFGFKEKIVILSLLLLLAACSSEAEIDDPAMDETVESSANSADSTETDSTADASNVDKTFIIEGKNFIFLMDGKENPEIRVKLGDKVKIELNNVEGFHDWKVDEFGATEKVRAPASTSVEFTADKKGTFEYYCSVGSHREQGMKGVFVVE